jgi:Tfp pilus assembly protein PilP
MKKRSILILLLAACVLVVAACGESKADKAKKQVCNARSDIQTQVNKLKGLTLSTATTSEVKDSLNSIKSDLQTINDAKGDLSSELKQEVQSANQAFTSQFQSIISNLGTNLSLSSAQTQLQTALQQLASAYQSSFAKLSCS